MKRRDLIRKIAKAARDNNIPWTLQREGANHSVYDLDGLRIPIPRHREIGDNTTRDILTECEPKLGKGWWK